MNNNRVVRKLEQRAMKGDLFANFQLLENASNFFHAEDVEKKEKYYLEQCLEFLEKNSSNDGSPLNQLTLSKLELIDFRIFRELTIEFDQKLTVIIGENGSGKTGLIEAIAKVVSWICAGIETEGKNAKRIDYFDINVASQDCANVIFDFAFGDVTNIRGVLSRSIKGAEEKRDSDVAEIKYLANIFRVVNAKKGINLPVFAYYSVNRTSERTQYTYDIEKINDIRPRDKIALYTGSLEGFGQYTNFIESFLFIDNLSNNLGADYLTKLDAEIFTLKDMLHRVPEAVRVTISGIIKDKEETRAGLNSDSVQRYQKLREIIVDAISSAVETVSDIKVDRTSGRAQIKVKNNDIWININQLSQGQRVMFGLVGDLAFRMVTLNPSLSKPLTGRGIVLIDEVELHLHPRWQQSILVTLRKLFPNVQFIVTTHSPHVLSTVDKSCIRILSNGEDGTLTVKTPEFQTRGVTSSSVLEQLMNTFSIPPVEEAKWFETFIELLASKGAEDAELKEIYAKLKIFYGEGHPVILECNSLLRLQQLKAKAREKLSR